MYIYIYRNNNKEKIRNAFSRKGTSGIVRSGNGPQHNLGEFKKFAKDLGFRHMPSSPEYPRSNGLAEKAVETAKNFLEETKEDNKDPYLAVLEVRNAPIDN